MNSSVLSIAVPPRGAPEVRGIMLRYPSVSYSIGKSFAAVAFQGGRLGRPFLACCRFDYYRARGDAGFSVATRGLSTIASGFLSRPE